MWIISRSWKKIPSPWVWDLEILILSRLHKTHVFCTLNKVLTLGINIPGTWKIFGLVVCAFWLSISSAVLKFPLSLSRVFLKSQYTPRCDLVDILVPCTNFQVPSWSVYPEIPSLSKSLIFPKRPYLGQSLTKILKNSFHTSVITLNFLCELKLSWNSLGISWTLDLLSSKIDVFETPVFYSPSCTDQCKMLYHSLIYNLFSDWPLDWPDIHGKQQFQQPRS